MQEQSSGNKRPGWVFRKKTPNYFPQSELQFLQGKSIYYGPHIHTARKVPQEQPSIIKFNVQVADKQSSGLY